MGGGGRGRKWGKEIWPGLVMGRTVIGGLLVGDDHEDERVDKESLGGRGVMWWGERGKRGDSGFCYGRREGMVG